MTGVVARCIGRLGRLRLARCRAGATIVEFALVVPVIVTMLIGLIETGLILTAQGMLDAAANSAARVGSTGYTPTGTARETYIRNYVASQAFGIMDPAKLQVTPTAYASFAAIGQPDAGTPGNFGADNEVVVYTLTYPWHGFTPFLGAVFSNIDLRATVVVRNEPSPF